MKQKLWDSKKLYKQTIYKTNRIQSIKLYEMSVCLTVSDVEGSLALRVHCGEAECAVHASSWDSRQLSRPGLWTHARRSLRLCWTLAVRLWDCFSNGVQGDRRCQHVLEELVRRPAYGGWWHLVNHSRAHSSEISQRTADLVDCSDGVH